TLEDQVLMPLQDSVEMGMTLPQVVERIEQRDFYEPLFTEAFGDATVTTQRTSRALAQFVRSLTTYQSRFDQGRAMVANPGQNFPNFTAQENQGKNLFFAPPQAGGFNCAVCHAGEAQINRPAGATNNGVISNAEVDQGVFHTTGNPADRGKFKVPSLRNISVTAPYMHDGRFATLQETLQFYSTGIQNHANLDPVLRAPGPGGGQPVRFNMTQGEINALIAFFDTLTDTTMLNDPKFSDPFPAEMGYTYCNDAADNTTGFSASISATGSIIASANDLTLHAVNLPENQFSMFVGGPAQVLVLNPGGSQGNLCVGGGNFGRIANSLQLSGTIGAISYDLDLQNMPTSAAPYTTSITSGMTWNFQSWFRENGGNSNFSNAVSIFFL
ncbi:MAG: cytochrome c peroxidase, partial [Planctomycetota bacterium]|nr:cytochrome c peroxidase [Planctomycetota bacterium]